MTRIDFHTHVADRLHYACRLTRKAYLSEMPVVVLADRETLTALDRALWTFSPLEFIPHCLSGERVAAETPVVLVEDVAQAPHFGTLVNLGEQVPALFARFERLLEIVADEPAALSAGRDRYRFYRDRGYLLNSHKQGQTS